VIALLMMSLLGCGNKLPVHTITVADQSLRVEVAHDPETRARGLMFRDKLGADAGMLFIYPDTKPRGFWMKDTRIPLSIAFADASGKIVRISEMKPFDTERTTSIYPAKYALEMNKGWFDSKGISKGAMMTDLPTDLEVR